MLQQQTALLTASLRHVKLLQSTIHVFSKSVDNLRADRAAEEHRRRELSKHATEMEDMEEMASTVAKPQLIHEKMTVKCTCLAT